jgi:hypothetical protein
MSRLVNAFASAPMPVVILSNSGCFSVPRNIMCSKKCAKPVTPGSTSSRLPVRTIDQYDTSPSDGIGTTIAFSPFDSVRWCTS